jgi:hypothetical protein
MKRLYLLSIVFISGSVSAFTQSDFAQQWPVNVTTEGAYTVNLNEEIYRIIQKNDLSDLAAFNASGEPLPFGPMPATYGSMSATWVQAKAFSLPKEISQNPERLKLHIQHNASGELRIDANPSDQKLATQSNDWIIEVAELDQAVEALHVQVSKHSSDFSAQLVVQASTDLQQWQYLNTATIVSLQQDGQSLQRLQIELPGSTTKYLRIQSQNALAGMQISGFKIKQRPVGVVKLPQLQWLSAKFIKKDRTAFIYELPARILPEQVNIVLKNTNTIAQFAISARQDEHDYWQPQSSLTVFRLRAAGVSLDNEASNMQAGRLRYWRIESNTDITEVPVLNFSYRPEQFLLLTHGAGPYTIVAGSMIAQRDNYPLDVLISQVKQNQGRDWKPTEASLGKALKANIQMQELSKIPTDKRNILLWLVLLFGVGAVVMMVLKLIRQAPKQ